MSAILKQIDQFHRFALAKAGAAEMDSIEELFDLWRIEHPTPDELRTDVLAIAASLRDMERGETGRPFAEFSRDFAAKGSSFFTPHV